MEKYQWNAFQQWIRWSQFRYTVRQWLQFHEYCKRTIIVPVNCEMMVLLDWLLDVYISAETSLCIFSDVNVLYNKFYFSDDGQINWLGLTLVVRLQYLQFSVLQSDSGTQQFDCKFLKNSGLDRSILADNTDNQFNKSRLCLSRMHGF